MLNIFNEPINIIIPLLMFFAPIKGIFLTVATVIVLDTIVGLWKARHLKQKITSRKLSGVISKLLLYQSLILVTYLIGQFITAGAIDKIFSIEHVLTKGVSLVLIYIELKSINESYHIVKNINIWDHLRELVSRTKELKDGIKEIKEEIKEIKEIKDEDSNSEEI